MACNWEYETGMKRHSRRCKCILNVIFAMLFASWEIQSSRTWSLNSVVIIFVSVHLVGKLEPYFFSIRTFARLE